jgi:phosphatidylserine/phosphatidylglycerophosphate/cardiolipin synthase-like enzyme
MLESLAQTPLSESETEPGKNGHKVQMLRTVSVGAYPQDIRRDDIWRSYFRLIGCATRFIFMENQYFFEPKLADAIAKQAEAQPDLIVIIVVSFETDDPTNDYTKHGRALQNEFFTRLFAGVPPTRLRVYTMVGRLVHSKLVLADDQFLTVGSANANPRGFFMDTELNVMLNDSEAVKRFRHKLWTHDLGALPGKVATWGVPDFIPQWDVVAKFNDKLKKTPEKMVGECVVPFDPRFVKGQRAPFIPDVLSES